MTINILGLGWIGFCIVIAVFIYVNHLQYMEGHDTYIFSHKTTEEKRILEAQTRIIENQAGIDHDISKETNPQIFNGSTR